ncbi:hypothetical protein O181_021025 [Austropuccinia psidii MF-1]|uniref:Uncharacterized protein n=1 Tax=Austropuccinia psidii MF-1 TaxID=1389203 RepID=A0A9Q3CDT1_9BASI|nr:hypothetical protein [Austropuccinia psidii MF-1]
MHKMETNFIPLETQSQANTSVTPSEQEGSKGKGKRHSEGLITAERWTPILTQRNRKPQDSASIQGKPALTTCTGKITIINPVVTSKGKLPKEVDSKFVQRPWVQRNQPEDREGPSGTRRPEGGHLGHSGGSKTLREVIPTLPFTFQFNRNLRPGDWKDMDQVLQLHQLLNDLFQWSMENKSFNLASHWEELGASFQKICLRDIDFKDLMVITKCWNPTRKFRLPEVRANRIRENQSTIQAIQEELTQKGHTQIP